MCCFSGKVESVSDTRIFARLDGAAQVLVYAMAVDTKAVNAMVLPLPTAREAREAGEKAVEFVSLEGNPGFFGDLDGLFTPALSEAGSLSLGAPLAVQKVGAFEASFVPSAADFGRLDPRFRLPPGIWRGAPDSLDYGFAVFQLSAGRGRIHPMALRFTTRDPETLFFPTLHIHDGNVQELEFGGVFNRDNAFIKGNAGRKGIEQSGFSGTRAARDNDVHPGTNSDF